MTIICAFNFFWTIKVGLLSSETEWQIWGNSKRENTCIKVPIGINDVSGPNCNSQMQRTSVLIQYKGGFIVFTNYWNIY